MEFVKHCVWDDFFCEKIIPYTMFYKLESRYNRNGRKKGIVDDIVVAPAYKRRGLAQAMLTECFLLMGERGTKRVRLHTDATDRHGARSLYEKLGFRAVKLFPRYRKPMGV